MPFRRRAAVVARSRRAPRPSRGVAALLAALLIPCATPAQTPTHEYQLSAELVLSEKGDTLVLRRLRRGTSEHTAEIPTLTLRVQSDSSVEILAPGRRRVMDPRLAGHYLALLDIGRYNARTGHGMPTRTLIDSATRKPPR